MGSLFQSKSGLLQHIVRTLFPNAAAAPAGLTGGASPAPAPGTSSAGVTAAGRAEQQQLLSHAGRAPTILTPPDTRGGAYTATKLGAGS